MRTVLVLAILSVAIAGGFYSPFGALLGYIWFAIFRPQEFLWVKITALRLSLALGVLLVVRCSVARVFPDVTHPLSVAMLVAVALGGLSHLTAVNPTISLEWLNYLVRLVLVCLLMIRLVDTPRRFTLAVVVMAASFGFYSGKAGLASIIEGGLQYGEGIGGAFSDNNGYALGTVMTIPLLVLSGQLLRRQWAAVKPLSLFLFACVPLSMVTVVSTFSRGGFLGMAVSGLTLILLQKRRMLALSAATVLVGVAVLVIPIRSGYVNRMETIRTYREIGEKSAMSRLHFWSVAIAMAKDRPLGVGLRCFESAYDRYDNLAGGFGKNRSVHSSHFQMLAELGFPGLFTWVVLFWLAFRSALRVRRRGLDPRLSGPRGEFLVLSANALLASMTGFLAGGSFFALALNDLTWLTFALVASIDIFSRRMLDSPGEPGRVNGSPSLVGDPSSNWS